MDDNKFSRRTFVKVSAVTAAALCLFCLFSCNRTLDSDGPTAPVDKILDGAWKVQAYRVDGGLVPAGAESYFLIAPEDAQMIIVSEDEDKSGRGESELLQIRTDGTTLFVYPADIAKEDIVDQRAQYTYSMQYVCDGEELHLELPVGRVLPAEQLGIDPECNVHIILARDTELEKAAESGTKFNPFHALADWLNEKIHKFYDEVMRRQEKHRTNGIPPAPEVADSDKEIVTSSSWANTGGWERGSWMSKLDGKLPVCMVNIPGSHDSATASDNMGFMGEFVHADCQTLSIEEQYNLGARYFDFRVGYKWEMPLISDYPTVDDLCADGKDLMMFHGPISTGVGFIASMRLLANRLKDSKEFVFINVQPERESNGLDVVLSSKVVDKSKIFSKLGINVENDLYKLTNHTAMAAAHKMMRALDHEFGDSLFVAYSSKLTVDKVRGHIILLIPDSYKAYQEGLRASYLSGWPDNSTGPAMAYTGEKGNGERGNMYVQSYYEMATEGTWKIDDKVTAMWDLAKKVSEDNANEKYVLGFSATNANTGSAADLESFRFAHAFNGWMYEMYVKNMLDSRSGAVGKYRCGIVPMDHYGAHTYKRSFLYHDVSVYGDNLSWAVIESNFF